MSKPLPRRRTERVVVREVGRETLVYDLDADTVHNLPAQTARFWTACDGTQSLDQLRLLAGLSEQEAVAVLAQLADKGLMSSGTTGVPRRTVLQAAAVGAGAVAVGSVAVPANAQQLASICADPDPLDGGSLCETFKEFFTTPPFGLTFPASGCTPGDVGTFDTLCPGFQLYYKESNSDSINSIANLKTAFSLCRSGAEFTAAGQVIPAGTKYINMKGTGQQQFEIYDPNVVNGSGIGTCGCNGGCGGVFIDLSSSNSFIFSYNLPANAPAATYYLRTSVCFPATSGPQPRLQIYNGTVNAQSGNITWDTELLPVTTIANASCQTYCVAVTNAQPFIGVRFTNPQGQIPATGIYVESDLSQTPC